MIKLNYGNEVFTQFKMQVFKDLWINFQLIAQYSRKLTSFYYIYYIIRYFI